MDAMMEAMMSVKKIMEANAVAIAATSVVAKVNPTSLSGINQMNHPTSDMVGKDLGSTGGPHDVQIQNKHAFPPYVLPLNYTPPNVAYTPNKNVNNPTPIPIESQQPQTDHAHADLLPYLLDNSMVAITLAKVHQPPFLREYDSKETCACHGEAPGRSIEHCRALKRKVQGLIDAGWLKFEENRVIYTLREFPERFAKDRIRDHTHKTPSGPEEVQQGPGVSSSGGGPLSVLQGARSPSKESHPQRHSVDPKKSNRALGFPALGSRPQDTQWTRRSPTGSWSCQALITGLCQFYGVPVAPSKVIRPPTNRAFIKKYCVPRQAQDETPQQPRDGRQRATDAPPSPLEFTSAHPQKG
ncbi:hypothetical protein HKD37_03G007316 [Glycine soja]